MAYFPKSIKHAGFNKHAGLHIIRKLRKCNMKGSQPKDVMAFYIRIFKVLKLHFLIILIFKVKLPIKSAINWKINPCAGCIKTCRLENFPKLIKRAGCNKTLQVGIFWKINRTCCTFIRYLTVCIAKKYKIDSKSNSLLLISAVCREIWIRPK